MESCLHLKICLIGTSGVGKTSLVTKLLTNDFDERNLPTVGVEFRTQKITIDGKAIALDIWDSAGQEKYKAVVKSYFREAVGCLLVFDITSPSSFNELGSWLNEFHQYAHPSAFILLIGNKCDLEEKRVITPLVAEQFADENKLIYIETSACNGKNVKETFERLAGGVIKLIDEKKIIIQATGAKEINKNQEDKHKSCC